MPAAALAKKERTLLRTANSHQRQMLCQGMQKQQQQLVQTQQPRMLLHRLQAAAMQQHRKQAVMQKPLTASTTCNIVQPAMHHAYQLTGDAQVNLT